MKALEEHALGNTLDALDSIQHTFDLKNGEPNDWALAGWFETEMENREQAPQDRIRLLNQR